MEKFSVGDIVLVRFPFSDLSQQKLRPALVLADVKRGDWILCQITSQPYHDQRAVQLEQSSFTRGHLIKTSYVRPAKLFTANAGIVERVVAHLNPEIRQDVVRYIVELLQHKN